MNKIASLKPGDDGVLIEALIPKREKYVYREKLILKLLITKNSLLLLVLSVIDIT